VRTPIDDPNDPRIGVFLGLRDHAARQKRELPGGDMASFFIAEGDLVIERAVHHGYRLRSVLIAARRTKPLPPEVGASEVFEASNDVLTEITGRPELRDPLACFDRPEESGVDELLTNHRTFAVLENVNNPNNLGVIMRNAAGLGIDAVLLDPTCGDPLYRRAVRASMGQVFAIPHARIDAFPEGLDLLHDRGITTVALSPSGEVDLRELERPAKVAILLGAEGPGLTDATLSAANVRARIDMAREVDSLNVANAAAIAFFHLTEKPPTTNN
jgi:tRNA G18 (ribose-2'-O)-methylase SpoU